MQFVMAKWVGSLLLPPALLALVLLLVWLALPRWPRCRHAVLLVAALLFVLATPWAGTALLRQMEDYPALRLPLQPEPASALVVLGGGAEDWAPEMQAPAPSLLTLQRLHYAAWLQRRSHLPVLVTGGRVGEGPAEGEVMARVLRQDYGVPVRWVEVQARNTRENAAHSQALLAAAGVRHVYLVTQAWHMPRAVEEFRRRGLRVTPAPTGFMPELQAGPRTLLPGGYGMWCSYLAMHEALGRLHQRLTAEDGA